MRPILAILLLLASGCASTPSLIVGGPQSLKISNPTIVTDLQSAAYNLDSAVAVGALQPDDPAPKCVHDVLVKAGIEIPAGQEPAKSFVPKHDGLASAGAIAYILAQQLKQAAAKSTPVSMNCEQLVGRIVIDGAKAVNKAALSIIPGR